MRQKTELLLSEAHEINLYACLDIISLSSGGSRAGVWGGSQIGGRQKCLHLLKYQRLSATIVVCYAKEVIFCRSKNSYFCWSNYAIFQGITTVWKRFISLIQKTFETGPKQWASFFASYTDLSHICKMYLKGPEACYAQAFATVSAIPSEINKEQCLKRIPDLVRNRTVLLRLEWKAFARTLLPF